MFLRGPLLDSMRTRRRSSTLSTRDKPVMHVGPQAGDRWQAPLVQRGAQGLGDVSFVAPELATQSLEQSGGTGLVLQL